MTSRIPPPQPASRRSEFAESLRMGLLVGGAVLLLVLPPVANYRPAPAPQSSPAPRVAQAPAPPRIVPPAPVAPRPVRLADFGDEHPSPEARQVANWVVDSRDHKSHFFVIIDKKEARVFVFDRSGRLVQSAPALLGAASGDDSVPGIGEKPLSQVLPEEKTTPAGRFVAELGVNTKGEDIVWVDYDAAVSMHRVRNVKGENRFARLASPETDDNRISFGCINLPVPFYEQVLKPAVVSAGAVVYVLPETRGPAEVFASFYDVSKTATLAQR
jgi:hypothetical protein